MQKKKKVRRQTIINGGKLLLFLAFLALSVISAVELDQYALSALFLVIGLIMFGLYFR